MAMQHSRHDPKCEPDILTDILEWDYTDYGPVDVFWAGTPCTLFSNASFKRDPAQGNILAQKTLENLERFKKLNERLVWFIENPFSSLLKHREGFRTLPHFVLDYCQYSCPSEGYGYK